MKLEFSEKDISTIMAALAKTHEYLGEKSLKEQCGVTMLYWDCEGLLTRIILSYA